MGKEIQGKEWYYIFDKKTFDIHECYRMGYECLNDKYTMPFYYDTDDGESKRIGNLIFTEINPLYEDNDFIYATNMSALNDAIEHHLLFRFYHLTDTLKRIIEIKKSYNEEKRKLYKLMGWYDKALKDCDNDKFLKYYRKILEIYDTYLIEIHRDENGNVDFYKTIKDFQKTIGDQSLDDGETKVVNTILNEAITKKDAICFTFYKPNKKYTLLTDDIISVLKANWNGSLYVD